MWPYWSVNLYIWWVIGASFCTLQWTPTPLYHCYLVSDTQGPKYKKIVFPWVHVHIVHMVFWSTNTITWSGNPKGLSDDQLDIRVAILLGMPLLESPRDTHDILMNNTRKTRRHQKPNKLQLGLGDDQLDIRAAIFVDMLLVESPESPRNTHGILISNTHKIGNIRSPNKTPTEAQVMTSLTSGLPYLWTCSL